MTRLDMPHTLVRLPRARLYQYINSRPRHIVIGMGRSPVREQDFKWAGPLMNNPTYLFKRKNSSLQIQSLDDARKVASIGVVNNDFSHSYLNSLGFTNIQINNEASSLLDMLVAERFDLVASGEVSYLMRRRQKRSDDVEKTSVLVFDSKLYVAFSKDIDDSWVERWQHALEHVKNSAQHAEIYHRYFGERPWASAPP